jgi:4-hydroxybenzoate polyprenyltransferase/phosphoserine phosphatase
MHETSDLPLVLDLDGTLLATDSLHESLLLHLRERPMQIFRLPIWLREGRAGFKSHLAEALTQEHVETLPVNAEIVDLAEKEAKAGRRIVLATAANRGIAEKIAARFPFISEILASDAKTNLKGAAKAEALERKYPQGFLYAGDSAADLPVWRKAKGAIVVGRGGSLARQAAETTPVLASIDPRPEISKVLVKALRLHQWAKNALVFVPLILAGLFHSRHAWAATICAFLALGLLASATYIANDMWDIAEDRRHWSKRRRPLASGRLSLPRGLGLILLCGFGAFALGVLDGPKALAVLAVYLASSLLYSLRLKREPIVDVFVISAMFTIRLVLGQVVTGAQLSPWLLVFSMFTFLSLSLVKRYTEVTRMVAHGFEKAGGRGYTAEDGVVLGAFGAASSMASVLILVLYLVNAAFEERFYRHPVFLWGFPALLFLFLGRIWILCHRGQIHDDPVAYALKDRLSLFYAAAAGVLFLAATIHF